MSRSPSFARDCLTRHIDDLLTRSHSSSIYPSAVSLFVLLSLSFVFPSPLSFYPISLFLSIRELHEQVLCSSSYRVPCPSLFFSRTMFHHSTRNLSSRAQALRILQPADHIITLFIKPTAIATIQSSSPPLSALSSNSAFFLEGGIRSIGLNLKLVLILRFLLLLSFNLIYLRYDYFR